MPALTFMPLFSCPVDHSSTGILPVSCVLIWEVCDSLNANLVILLLVIIDLLDNFSQPLLPFQVSPTEFDRSATSISAEEEGDKPGCRAVLVTATPNSATGDCLP